MAVKLLAEIAPLRMTTVAMYSGKFIRERNDAAKRWMLATMRGARELQGPELGVSYADKFYTPENLAVFEQHTGASTQVIRNQVPYTWDPDLEIQLDFIRPGKPIENPCLESCTGRLRDECLSVALFFSVQDAREKLERWRADYNRVRPHSALQDRTPAEVAAAWASDSRRLVETLT